MRIKGVKRWNVYNLFGRRCAYCGAHLIYGKFEVDHIISSIEFHARQFMTADVISVYDGEIVHNYNDSNNLFPACIKCNRIKKHLSLEDFRYYLHQVRCNFVEENPKLRILNQMGLLTISDEPVTFFFEKVPSHRN